MIEKPQRIFPYVIGVDIGGTSVRCGLVNAKGSIHRGSLRKVSVNSKGNQESILESFCLPLRENLQQAASEGLPIMGIGIGMCGPLDYEKGISLIEGVDKYELLYGINLKDEFRLRLKLPGDFPIVFESDAWAFARGEAWRGHGKGYRRIMAITLGSGLGSAFVLDGRLLSEGPGVPPPYAWIGGLPWGEGILDDVISRRGILALYRSLSENAHKKNLDVQDIARLAKNGDLIGIRVFQEFGELLGGALAPILKKFAAECLIFGGRISKSYPLFEPSLVTQLDRLSCLKRITVARSISLAPIWGAARLAFSEVEWGKNENL